MAYSEQTQCTENVPCHIRAIRFLFADAKGDKLQGSVNGGKKTVQVAVCYVHLSVLVRELAELEFGKEKQNMGKREASAWVLF